MSCRASGLALGNSSSHTRSFLGTVGMISSGSLNCAGHSEGVPSTRKIRRICSISVVPGKSGLFKNSSAIIAPIAHISTALEYTLLWNSSSGARYQRVEQYSVKGGPLLMNRARPWRSNCYTLILTVYSRTKSASLMILPAINKFSGLMSRCIKPMSCITSTPFKHWYIRLRIILSERGPFWDLSMRQRVVSMNSKTR